MDASERASVKSTGTKANNQNLGQKKQSKANCRYCKGCDLWYCPVNMASKSSMCHRCKHCMDNISRAAAAEGQKDWAKELRGDPFRLQAVLKKYRQMVGTEAGNRTKLPKGTLFQSLQQVSAKSRILFDTELEMMSDDTFMQHSATDAGGRLSKSAAKAQWALWEQQIKSGDAPEDLIYDTKKGFLRIACSTRDTVHMQNDSCFELERSKTLQTREKEQKNISSDELMRKKKELAQGHDQIFGDDCDDFNDPSLTMSLVRSAGSSGQSFHGRSQDVNLSELITEGASASSLVIPGAEEVPSAEEEGPKKPDPKPKGRGWDKATQITAKVRAEQGSLLELECALNQRLADVEKVKKELQNKSSECQAEVAMELCTVEKRRSFLKLVLDKTEEGINKLSAEIQKVTDSAADGNAEEEAGCDSQSRSGQIQKAPPCASFARLCTLKSLENMVEELYGAESASELRDLVKARATARKPITELCAASKTAVVELRKAITAFQQRALKRTSGGGNERVKKSAKTSGGLGSYLLDGGFEQAASFACHSSGTVKEDPLKVLGGLLHEPLLVTFNDSQKQMFETSCFKAATDIFIGAFAGKVKKEDLANAQKPLDQRVEARAAAKLSDEACHDVEEVLRACFLRHAINSVKDLSPGLCDLAHFGIQGGSIMSGAEQEQLASVRYLLKGNRTLVCAPASDILLLMQKSGVAKKGCNLSSMWKFFMDMNDSMVQTLLSLGGKLYAVTQGPGDLLYIPSGFVFAERVGTQSDCLGVVLRGLVTPEHDSAAKSRLESVKNIVTDSGDVSGLSGMDKLLSFYQ
ncbi:Uncharacterized protein SCF082_LOCUS6964 [Durusdinium trenchii]|uniref:JmjC domain-containing protein n=1 Tax=Durusdinium trenchii TaxID=1381693 RepID=A0ABP0IG16_9DINO